MKLFERKTKLDRLIEALEQEMLEVSNDSHKYKLMIKQLEDPETEEEQDLFDKITAKLVNNACQYNDMLANLDILLKAKSTQRAASANGFTADTLLIVGGNLLGIILILKHEKFDVIASKALGFVIKGRV